MKTNRKTRSLIIASNDRFLLSAIPWIKGEVSYYATPEEAVLAASMVRGAGPGPAIPAVLAYGPDIFPDIPYCGGVLPGCPKMGAFKIVGLYTEEDRDMVHTSGLALTLDSVHRIPLYEIPIQLDWLHSDMGTYEDPR